MIKSFFNKETEKVFNLQFSKKLPTDIQRPAARKLRVLDAVSSLEELCEPPSNHLEALKGDRAGQHSIRINAQWRICFEWIDGNAQHVEICDYH